MSSINWYNFYFSRSNALGEKYHDSQNKILILPNIKIIKKVLTTNYLTSICLKILILLWNKYSKKCTYDVNKNISFNNVNNLINQFYINSGNRGKFSFLYFVTVR